MVWTWAASSKGGAVSRTVQSSPTSSLPFLPPINPLFNPLSPIFAITRPLNTVDKRRQKATACKTDQQAQYDPYCDFIPNPACCWFYRVSTITLFNHPVSPPAICSLTVPPTWSQSERVSQAAAVTRDGDERRGGNSPTLVALETSQLPVR